MTDVADGIGLEDTRALEERYLMRTYKRAPVDFVRGEGPLLWDADGKRYLDMLAAYSALNFGHRHPRLIAAARRQLDHLTLVSRAFEHDQFWPIWPEWTWCCR